MDCFGKRQKVFRWDETEEIVYWETIADVAMRARDGKQFDFGSTTIADASQLAETVCGKVSEAMVPRIASLLQRGETAHFGRIQANRAGIEIHHGKYASPLATSFYQGPWPHGDKRKEKAKRWSTVTMQYSWQDVLGIDQNYEHDLFLVTREGAIDICCSPSDVPNAILLPALAKAMRL